MQYIYIYLTYTRTNGFIQSVRVYLNVIHTRQYNTIQYNVIQRITYILKKNTYTHTHIEHTYMHAYLCTKRNNNKNNNNLANMDLGHLLTRSGPTHPEISLVVTSGSFYLSTG
jgi:hypothetical protein